jgi:hypothetical protein
MDQVSNAITGRFTDQTMWYLILGIAAAVGGTPGGPVVAEDVRDLQCRAGQGATRYTVASAFWLLLARLRGSDSRWSGLSIPAIMAVATRV